MRPDILPTLVNPEDVAQRDLWEWLIAAGAVLAIPLAAVALALITAGPDRRKLPPPPPPAPQWPVPR
jgi:hypothetical protein